ncbi:MAG: efflux RND transporter periplasmic adaptor subunit [Bdellovibrionaceae bacterium]|nr:efflux RND transporter periplasmic adaptor subunit [Pseudobdellovibrionaceae bacterium]
MKRQVYIALVVTVVLVFVVVAFTLIQRPSLATKKTVLIRRGDLVEAVYAIGSVKADRVFNLKMGVTTKMLERYVRAGDRVKKGDKLVRLEGLQIVTAPFDGMITHVAFEKGELVFSQAVIVTVVDPSSYFIEISVDERNVPLIKSGQVVDVSFEGVRVQRIFGTVRSVYSKEGEFLVAIDADLSPISLLQGMTCDVAVRVSEYKNQILVPLGALSKEGGVRVIRNGRSKVVPLKLGAKNSQYMILKEGDIKENDEVVIEDAGMRGPASGPEGSRP